LTITHGEPTPPDKAMTSLPLSLPQGEALVIVAKAADILNLLPADRLALPRNEAERIHRYKKENDRRARRAAHGLARHCLGLFLSRAPESLIFTRDPKGRPYLADVEGWDFNLSHGGRWIAVGLSRAGRIGVDVQEGGDSFDWKAVSRAYLHKDEIETLQKLATAGQSRAALQLWCLKEAFLKATGEGLSTPPYRLYPQPSGEGWHLSHQGYEMKAAAHFLPDASCSAWATELAASLRVVML
jgi:4'-phosphopantetheinyl transferase